MHPPERTRTMRFDTFKSSVRLGSLTHSSSREIRGEPVLPPFSTASLRPKSGGSMSARKGGKETATPHQ